MGINLKKMLRTGVALAALISTVSMNVNATSTANSATGTSADATAAGTATATAGASTADAATAGASTDAAAGEGAAANGETVNEDGSVTMEGATGEVDASKWITKDDYEKVAESDTYIMYLYEPRMSIMLENKETGEILESTLSDEKDDGNSNATWVGYMKSGIVLTAIKGTNNTYQVDLNTVENKIDYAMNDNGFTATVSWPSYGFTLDVDVTLDGDDLVVTVPEDSIQETQADTYISTVSLFPMMGYTYLDDQAGYMFVPDGNGALIYLDNKEGRFSTGFSQMIYGDDDGFTDSSASTYLWEKYDTVLDPNQVIAPVFGMAHTQDQLGYLAIVESGEMRASIEAQPNGVMVNYNRCFAKFLLRDIYVQPLNQSNSGTVTEAEADRAHGDLSVRYKLLSGDDADYSGMAVSYRNYLLDSNALAKKDTSYNTRVDFLGTDREEFLLGTKAVTMTTTDNIETMYSELQDAGVSSLLSVYKGWQKNGLYSVPISSYKADSHIGGTKSLTNLINSSGEKNYNLYLYNDALQVNARTNKTTFNVAKKVNKRTLEKEYNKQVYDTFYYLLPNKTVSELTNMTDSYTKKGVNNLAVAGISDTLFSYSHKGNYYTRQDTAEDYEKTLAGLDESTDLILEQPFSYLWQYTDAFLDMPLGSSDYMYLDEEVPFMSIVLKGIVPMYSDYVNFEANQQEFFLQMVESGVYPSFYLTYENSSALIYTNSSDLYSTEYATYKDQVVSYDKELRAVADKVQDACIIDHEKMDNGVTKVTYDNGVVIYVNYTDADVTVDGVNVGAMSYEVGEV